MKRARGMLWTFLGAALVGLAVLQLSVVRPWVSVVGRRPPVTGSRVVVQTRYHNITLPPLGTVAETDSSTPIIVTAWCVMQDDNTKGGGKFAHIAHFLQTMTLCWSWFLSLPSTQIRHRGVVVNGRLAGFGAPQSDWRAQLLQVMNCSYEYDLPQAIADSANASHGHIFYKPPLEHTNNRRYFWKSDDASTLRQHLFDLVESKNLTVEGDSWHTASVTLPASNWSMEPKPRIHIGLVDREKTRRILNLEEIERAIEETYPMAHVERAWMENKTPLEQMLWWSRMDVIVTAHGAAESNLIFLRREAAVVEIYPPHYYDPFFPPLAASAGVRMYGYFNRVKDPAADFANHSKTFAQRKKYRNVDLEPPVKDILKLVQKAIREEGNHRWSWIYAV